MADKTSDKDKEAMEEKQERMTRKRILKNVFTLSLVFFFNFVAYGGLAALQVGRSIYLNNFGSVLRSTGSLSTVRKSEMHFIEYTALYIKQNSFGVLPAPKQDRGERH